MQDHVEPAINHSFSVERHVRLDVFQARVGHDLRVDRVALGAGPVDRPGEDHDLVVLRLYCTREGGEFAIRDVVANALYTGERAVFPPDFAGFARHGLVGLDVLLGHGDHETIDIGHRSLLTFRFDQRTTGWPANGERPSRFSLKEASCRRPWAVNRLQLYPADVTIEISDFLFHAEAARYRRSISQCASPSTSMRRWRGSPA